MRTGPFRRGPQAGRQGALLALLLVVVSLVGPTDLVWCHGPSGHSEIESAGASCCHPAATAQGCAGPTPGVGLPREPGRASAVAASCTDVPLAPQSGVRESARRLAPPAPATAGVTFDVPVVAARTTAGCLAITPAARSKQLRDLLRATVLTI